MYILLKKFRFLLIDFIYIYYFGVFFCVYYNCNELFWNYFCRNELLSMGYV